MAAVRNLSTSNRCGIQICYEQHANFQHAKRFPQVKCLREEKKDCRKMVHERSLCNPSHQFLKEFNLSTLSTSNVSDDGMEKPVSSSHDHGGLSSSRGHNEIPG